jgi:hypothetical protein
MFEILTQTNGTFAVAYRSSGDINHVFATRAEAQEYVSRAAADRANDHRDF